MITDKMIEGYLEDRYSFLDRSQDPEKWDDLVDAIKFAQEKILEMASEGFEEFWKEHRGDLVFEPSMHVSFTDYQLQEWERQAYEAATLACEKKHREEFEALELEQVRHIEIISEQFQKERAEMKEALMFAYDSSYDICWHGTKHVGLLEKLKKEKKPISF